MKFDEFIFCKEMNYKEHNFFTIKFFQISIKQVDTIMEF